jgi:hypothetical protein
MDKHAFGKAAEPQTLKQANHGGLSVAHPSAAAASIQGAGIERSGRSDIEYTIRTIARATLRYDLQHGIE